MLEDPAKERTKSEGLVGKVICQLDAAQHNFEYWEHKQSFLYSQTWPKDHLYLETTYVKRPPSSQEKNIIL